MVEIVESRILHFSSASGNGLTTRLLVDALDFFLVLRNVESLRKKPATAELLGWLTYLTERGAKPDDTLREHAGIVRQSLSTLVKSAEDQAAAEQEMEKWLGPTRRDASGV